MNHCDVAFTQNSISRDVLFLRLRLDTLNLRRIFVEYFNNIILIKSLGRLPFNLTWSLIFYSFLASPVYVFNQIFWDTIINFCKLKFEPNFDEGFILANCVSDSRFNFIPEKLTFMQISCRWSDFFSFCIFEESREEKLNSSRIM